MDGYENLETFKDELTDIGEDLNSYGYEGDELDQACQYFLERMSDPGDGSPNVQYISINGKPAYKDYWMTYDSLAENNALLAHGSEKDIIDYYLEYDYDYYDYDDEDEDFEELEENLFKSKDKYSILREALDRLDREDSRGKKSKTRVKIRALRSKLKQ